MDLDPLEKCFPGILRPGFDNRGEILVISGGRDTGKTTCCQGIIQRCQEAGWQVGGLLALGRFVNGQKTGYTVVDLASEESRLFASQILDEIQGFIFGRWTFDIQVMGWEINVSRRLTLQIYW